MNDTTDAMPAAPSQIESAMDTGQGADDEPEMTIGDRYDGGVDSESDASGTLSLDEAAHLLGKDAEHGAEQETTK